MSFMKGDPITITKEHLNAPWSGNKKNFRCSFCGYKFKLNDIFRCIYTNDIKDAPGNPLVCESCYEGKDKTRQKWKEMWENWRLIRKRYWCFLKWESD